MNRRGLMKLFGVGAVIAPVIGGVALAEDHVKLIAEPKVEIASPPTFEPVTDWSAMNRGELDVTVFMKDRKSGPPSVLLSVAAAPVALANPITQADVDRELGRVGRESGDGE